MSVLYFSLCVEGSVIHYFQFLFPLDFLLLFLFFFDSFSCSFVTNLESKKSTFLIQQLAFTFPSLSVKAANFWAVYFVVIGRITEPAFSFVSFSVIFLILVYPGIWDFHCLFFDTFLLFNIRILNVFRLFQCKILCDFILPIFLGGFHPLICKYFLEYFILSFCPSIASVLLHHGLTPPSFFFIN